MAKGTIYEKALYEEGVDEKEFPVDQALQQIGFWKNTYLPNERIPLKDEWEKQVYRLYEYYERQKKNIANLILMIWRQPVMNCL